MTTIAATELKNKVGQVLDQARREPILVQSHGRDAVVILDHAEFARLTRMEDAYWTAKADAAKEGGFLSPEESMAWLKARLDDEE